MVISRTPFRVSFFGGGTDYPDWYRKHGGAVISTTINKYCYLSVRRLPPFFNHRIRLAYSQVEHCREVAEIQHPAFREIMRRHGIEAGIEAHYDGDLPARSGMGSSSSFAVGLLHAFYALGGRMVSARELAEEAIQIEREVLKETVGCQDQVAAAYGGLNHIRFETNEQFVVKPVVLSGELTQAFNDSLMLYFTGTGRFSSEVAKTYYATLPDKEKSMKTLGQLVEEALERLKQQDLDGFGRLLHEGWQLKRGLSASISTDTIDQAYEAARVAGALGGKVLGAGGGGFMLLFVPPERQAVVQERLKALLLVPFKFEHSGSKIIYYDPET